MGREESPPEQPASAQEAYVATLRRLRWPDGVHCPRCPGESGDVVKEGPTDIGTQRYACHGCGRTFTDLTGTVFAGRRMSLQEMCSIINQMDDTPITEIAAGMERRYKTVWSFVDAVRAGRGEGHPVALDAVCEEGEFS